jgi:hypothetical protein
MPHAAAQIRQYERASVGIRATLCTVPSVTGTGAGGADRQPVVLTHGTVALTVRSVSRRAPHSTLMVPRS